MTETPNRTGVTRRRLVQGAAWSVPAVAFAGTAPAFAVSPCTPTVDFDQMRPGTRPTTITFLPSGMTATLAFSRSWSGGGATGGMGDTGLVAATNTNPSWNYVEMEMTGDRSGGSYITMTLTFPSAVEGLSFVLHDIDRTSSWHDTVQVMTPGFTYVRGSNIQGTGTWNDRFRPITTGDTPISSGQGDLRLTWPGLVTQVQIRYVAGQRLTAANQHIGLGDISYNDCVMPGSGQQRRMAETRQKVELSTEAPAFLPEDGAEDR
ncbi:hypothetical protein ACPCG0_10410 [Propionibacteriaceae bacterium Y1923]|uniref:hypothetical protein n=1 Tax=Aestuariimicrobium sp. Y1814 TaxID=3418742 RepID=UPI003C253765